MKTFSAFGDLRISELLAFKLPDSSVTLLATMARLYLNNDRSSRARAMPSRFTVFCFASHSRISDKYPARASFDLAENLNICGCSGCADAERSLWVVIGELSSTTMAFVPP